MSATRPDPDRLLADITAQQQRAARGQLKIFFGASPGVGKTYAMLQSLRQLHDEGRRVLVGVAETHGRPETARLLENLPHLPLRELDHRGRMMREFDLDAALEAHPDLVAVDELAHSNVEGSRHRKRWQDVEELLSAGIDVHSTLNVQHLESLNDIVGRITGVRVRETVPDHVFDAADDVVVVDLPADELLKRLSDGKVYMPDVAQRAREHFFRKGNLIALRELALRRAADRVDAQMRDYRRTRAIEAVWPTRERMLVGVAGTDADERLVRDAARLAGKLEADWIAAHVDVAQRRRGKRARSRIAQTLELAASFGAEATTLPGVDVADTLIACARARNVNRLLLGHKPRSPWQFWHRSTVDRIGRRHPDLDLIVIAQGAPRRAAVRENIMPRIKWSSYLWASLACFAATAVASVLLRVFAVANVVMLFLLTVVLVALRLGRGPGAWAAFLAVACFDFFFVPPRLSMSVSDTQYIFTFLLMLGVALTIGQLTARLRHEARVAVAREQRATTLARLSRELSAALTVEQIIEIALRDFGSGFHAGAGLLLPDEHDRVRAITGNDIALDESIAQWVYDHAQPAGAGTATLSAARARYIPLKAPMRVRGVLALEFPGADSEALQEPEEQRLLEACCSQLALALERVHFVEVAQHTLVQIEGERMRNTLLSAVSHDLRTPLTTILGAAQAAEVQTRGHAVAPLVASIGTQARRMLRLIENLLDMARLQSRGVELDRQWQSLEEIVGSALRDLDEPLHTHPVHVDLPADLPLLEVDALLIERVLVNLLENATKHTPPATPIEVQAREVGENVVIEVNDSGPGLPQVALEKLFNPFERGNRESSVTGIGLGLALARQIVDAHGGKIEARRRVPRGASFVITLPAPTPPKVETTP